MIPAGIWQNADRWIAHPPLETPVFYICSSCLLVAQRFVEHVHAPLWIIIPGQGYTNRGAAKRHKEWHLMPLCFPSTVTHCILLVPRSIAPQFSSTSASFLKHFISKQLFLKTRRFRDEELVFLFPFSFFFSASKSQGCAAHWEMSH